MEALDLGVEDDDALRIQQTQASQSKRATDAMEMEGGATVEDTNTCLLITEEGPIARSNIVALPPDNEVTHI